MAGVVKLFEGDLSGEKTLIILSSLWGDTKKRPSAPPTEDKNSICSNEDKMYINLVLVSVKGGGGGHCIN